MRGIFRCLLVVLAVLAISHYASGLRINEVMADPNDSCNDCTEWIEIYSETPVEVINWTIDTNAPTQKINFSYHLEDFLIITKNKTVFLNISNVNSSKVIEGKSIGLTNSGDAIYIFNSSYSQIDYMNYSSSNPTKSWQYCNGSWILAEPTPGYENNCSSPASINNTSQNNTQTTNNTSTEESKNPEMILNFESISSQEFQVKVEFKNLESEKYDLKIFVEYDGKGISDIWDEQDEKWISGSYYLKEVVDKADEEMEVELRIKKDYLELKDDAKIIARIRESGSSKYWEEREDVELDVSNLGKTEKASVQSGNTEEKPANIEDNYSKAKAIRLEPKGIKSYKSKASYIKELALAGFVLFCLLVLLVLKNGRRDKSYDII